MLTRRMLAHVAHILPQHGKRKVVCLSDLCPGKRSLKYLVLPGPQRKHLKLRMPGQRPRVNFASAPALTFFCCAYAFLCHGPTGRRGVCRLLGRRPALEKAVMYVALAVRRWAGFYVWSLLSREMEPFRGSMNLLRKGNSGSLSAFGGTLSAGGTFICIC